MENKNQDIDHLRQEKEGLQERISKLEKTLVEQEEESFTLQKQVEDVGNKASAQIMALTTQVNNLQQELDFTHSVKSQLVLQIERECKANLEVAERKIEEMEEELQKSIESKHKKVDELEETIEDLKTYLEIKEDEVGLLIENLSTIEEDYGHFESRVYEILNEFQVAKNIVNETNTKKQQLKNELSVLIEQLGDKK
ncbi:COP1-interactive protein 1-like [Camellia sinensis]|uniref:COP1-interactive protein 1-like n=1 Tax=Camellia sinensis TaxID=4442 RepID=UPI001035F0A7|nr:COP1-interactive protein 1-like [Camellia sinensis]